MSDLQCPATLLIARHGEAKPVVDGVTSDDSGALTDKGRRQVQQLVEQVRPRRVAAVYTDQMEPAVESAEIAAFRLGLRPVVVGGLQELSVGDLAGWSSESERAPAVLDPWPLGDVGCLGAQGGDRAVKRFAEAIGGIADNHRGESVLVFTHGGVMSLAIPRLAVNVGSGLAGQRFLHNCAVAEVEVDADGWRLVSWPSATDRDMIR